MVKVYSPGGADFEAVKVIVLYVAGLGENDAVTPLGKPVAWNSTALLNPLFEFTDRYAVADFPRPTATSRLDNVKYGVPTVSGTRVAAVSLPETPVTVKLYCPGLTDLLAVRVIVLSAVTGLGEKEAVTPLGRPETERLTEPRKP